MEAKISNIYILIDFGSTYTKVICVDLDKEEVIAKAQSLSTVKENILIGLQNALQILTSQN